MSSVTAVTPDTNSGSEVTPASKIAPTHAHPNPVFSAIASA
ncbi:MAG TPA: hypothetical protein VLG46_18115 [Anaerolineae bacterium]|nr:hypothetical protein [Anaerolineae bacterium]